MGLLHRLSGMMLGWLRILLTAAACSQSVQADSVISIVGELKGFRDGSVEFLDAVAESLKKADETQEAELVAKWSDDWLSVLGMHRGITGLVKDYVLTYLGRSSYHDNNGELVDALRHLGGSFPKKTVTDEKMEKFRVQLAELCELGQELFADGGSLNDMMKEL